MSNIQAFQFESLPLNVIDKAGEPWFIAKEVCEILGCICIKAGLSSYPWFIAKEVCEILELSTTSRAVENLDDDEVSKTHTIDSLGRNQEVLIISESGLYTLIIRSNKPNARKFRKWVTGVVLPSIRKTGGYALQEVSHMEHKALYEKIISLQEEVIRLQNRLIELREPQAVSKYPMWLSEKIRAEVIKCYKNGYSARVISKMFGISINRVLVILDSELDK